MAWGYCGVILAGLISVPQLVLFWSALSTDPIAGNNLISYRGGWVLVGFYWLVVLIMVFMIPSAVQTGHKPWFRRYKRGTLAVGYFAATVVIAGKVLSIIVEVGYRTNLYAGYTAVLVAQFIQVPVQCFLVWSNNTTPEVPRSMHLVRSFLTTFNLFLAVRQSFLLAPTGANTALWAVLQLCALLFHLTCAYLPAGTGKIPSKKNWIRPNAPLSRNHISLTDWFKLVVVSEIIFIVDGIVDLEGTVSPYNGARVAQFLVIIVTSIVSIVSNFVCCKRFKGIVSNYKVDHRVYHVAILASLPVVLQYGFWIGEGFQLIGQSTVQPLVLVRVSNNLPVVGIPQVTRFVTTLLQLPMFIRHLTARNYHGSASIPVYLVVINVTMAIRCALQSNVVNGDWFPYASLFVEFPFLYHTLIGLWWFQVSVRMWWRLFPVPEGASPPTNGTPLGFSALCEYAWFPEISVLGAGSMILAVGAFMSQGSKETMLLVFRCVLIFLLCWVAWIHAPRSKRRTGWWSSLKLSRVLTGTDMANRPVGEAVILCLQCLISVYVNGMKAIYVSTTTTSTLENCAAVVQALLLLLFVFIYIPTHVGRSWCYALALYNTVQFVFDLSQAWTIQYFATLTFGQFLTAMDTSYNLKVAGALLDKACTDPVPTGDENDIVATPLLAPTLEFSKPEERKSLMSWHRIPLAVVFSTMSLLDFAFYDSACLGSTATPKIISTVITVLLYFGLCVVMLLSIQINTGAATNLDDLPELRLESTAESIPLMSSIVRGYHTSDGAASQTNEEMEGILAKYPNLAEHQPPLDPKDIDYYRCSSRSSGEGGSAVVDRGWWDYFLFSRRDRHGHNLESLRAQSVSPSPTPRGVGIGSIGSSLASTPGGTPRASTPTLPPRISPPPGSNTIFGTIPMVPQLPQPPIPHMPAPSTTDCPSPRPITEANRIKGLEKQKGQQQQQQQQQQQDSLTGTASSTATTTTTTNRISGSSNDIEEETTTDDGKHRSAPTHREHGNPPQTGFTTPVRRTGGLTSSRPTSPDHILDGLKPTAGEAVARTSTSSTSYNPGVRIVTGDAIHYPGVSPLHSHMQLKLKKGFTSPLKLNTTKFLLLVYAFGCMGGDSYRFLSHVGCFKQATRPCVVPVAPTPPTPTPTPTPTTVTNTTAIVFNNIQLHPPQEFDTVTSTAISLTFSDLPPIALALHFLVLLLFDAFQMIFLLQPAGTVKLPSTLQWFLCLTNGYRLLYEFKMFAANPNFVIPDPFVKFILSVCTFNFLSGCAGSWVS